MTESTAERLEERWARVERDGILAHELAEQEGTTEPSEADEATKIVEAFEAFKAAEI